MVALAVVLLILVFVTADFCVRTWLVRGEEKRKKQERLAALAQGVQLRFAEEATTLVRIEVSEPRARILAVDDEEVVLDSLRKVLVLEGYSIDTVEKGSEVLTLLKNHDYDFVFTDLKMPEMDGVEVVKAVKQFRPEIDVIVVTGYASIESAVETMKFGAMDYIQKPFSESELREVVNKFVIRREDRIRKDLRPQLHLVTASTAPSNQKGHFNVLAGVFISPQHVWLTISPNGAAQLGIDDFAQGLLGKIESVELPDQGQTISKGEPLCRLQCGSTTAAIYSPLSGVVRSVNHSLLKSPELLNLKPYETGWICMLEPTRLSSELPSMKIGADAIGWYKQEADRCAEARMKVDGSGKSSESALADLFLSAHAEGGGQR